MLFIKAYEVFELVIHLINTRLFCLLFYRCMSNKTQSYSRRLYNSSTAAVINGKLVTEVLALSSYSLYAMDHPRLGVKQVPFVSLRIQPSHLAPCRSECFAGETSTIEISHWWRTMYLESDQELQLIDVLIMFCTNDKQATKGRKGQMETRWIYYKIVIIRWIYSFYHNWVISRPLIGRELCSKTAQTWKWRDGGAICFSLARAIFRET